MTKPARRDRTRRCGVRWLLLQRPAERSLRRPALLQPWRRRITQLWRLPALATDQARSALARVLSKPVPGRTSIQGRSSRFARQPGRARNLPDSDGWVQCPDRSGLVGACQSSQLCRPKACDRTWDCVRGFTADRRGGVATGVSAPLPVIRRTRPACSRRNVRGREAHLGRRWRPSTRCRCS